MDHQTAMAATRNTANCKTRKTGQKKMNRADWDGSVRVSHLSHLLYPLLVYMLLPWLLLPAAAQLPPARQAQAPAAAQTPLPVAPKALLPAAHEAKTSDRTFLVLTIANATASSFDAWSSSRNLALTGYREANPILGAHPGNLRLTATAGATFASTTLISWWLKKRYPREAYWLAPPIVGALVHCVAGAHNVGIYDPKRRKP